MRCRARSATRKLEVGESAWLVQSFEHRHRTQVPRFNCHCPARLLDSSPNSLCKNRAFLYSTFQLTLIQQDWWPSGKAADCRSADPEFESRSVLLEWQSFLDRLVGPPLGSRWLYRSRVWLRHAFFFLDCVLLIFLDRLSSCSS